MLLLSNLNAVTKCAVSLAEMTVHCIRVDFIVEWM